MVDTYDHLFKFLIIGNAGVGKTCILKRFLDNTFKEISLHTIGVEFGTKIISVNDKLLKLQIWDTAGQERFQCVTRSYYRGAVGALIVYDITNRDSFNQVTSWLTNARELAKQGLVVILVGNKSDLADRSREVTEHEARSFAEENNIIAFLETSAKSGDNVSEAFIAAARKVLETTSVVNPTELIQPSINGALLGKKTSSDRSCSSC